MKLCGKCREPGHNSRRCGKGPRRALKGLWKVVNRKYHGCTNEPWYRSYEAMVNRVSGKHGAPCYTNVDMDPAWSDPKEFGMWAVQTGYSSGLTIDRLDPSRGYWPDNCQWVSLSENVRRSHVSSPRKKGALGRFVSQ